MVAIVSKTKSALALEFDTSFQRSSGIVVLLVGFVLGVHSFCFGALGGEVSSVAIDQAHLHASLRSTPKVGYVLHELRTDSGLLVREFSTTGGKVFAVAWEGPVIPDLRQLLGSHFEDFQRAAETQNRQGVHWPLFLQFQGLTVELGGHMRSYRGKAYLSDEVPASVKAEEIR